MNRVKEAFLLVQSLNMGERRRVSLNLEANSNYNKLFTRLKKTGLSEKDLDWKTAYDKNDTARILLTKIAESMHNFGYAENRLRKERKRKQVIQWYIMDAQFFYERNIFRLCKKRLLDAENEANKIYANTQLLTIYNLLLELKIRTIGNQLSSDIDENVIMSKLSDCLLAVKEYAQYRGINIQLFDIARQRLNPEDKEIILEDLNKRLSVPPTSNLAIQRYYQAKGVYHLLVKEPKKSLDYNLKARKWWEMPKNEEYKKEELYQYLLTLNNNAQSYIAIIAGQIGATNALYFKYKAALEETLSTIDLNLVGLRKDEKNKIIASHFKNKINNLILSKQLKKVEQLELWSKPKLFNSFNIKDKIVLLCQYTKVCFRLKKYEKCYQQIVQCYQFSKEDSSIRKDLIQHLYLLEGIIYSIWKEKNLDKLQKYYKNRCPIIKNLKTIEEAGNDSFIKKGLELLLSFNDCLPSERKQKFKPFAEHICQHINRPFTSDILSWLKQYPLSSGLSKVTAIRI